MRVVQNEQMTIGEIDISKMKFDLKSRDDIPKILRGLQFIYTNLLLRTAIFSLLESKISPETSKSNGRPGMTLWSILVCGVLRLDLNCDYDRLHELVNQHISIREILGHGIFDDVRYHFQTLKDNVSLLTPDLLDEINQLIVQAGHVLVKKRTTKRCVGVATPLYLKRMCTFLPTSTCCMTQCARSLRLQGNGANHLASAAGASTPTTSRTSNGLCVRRKTRSAARPNHLIWLRKKKR